MTAGSPLGHVVLEAGSEFGALGAEVCEARFQLDVSGVFGFWFVSLLCLVS